MTARANERRRRTARALIGVTAFVAALAAVAAWRASTVGRTPEVSGPVFAGWNAAETARIAITTDVETLTLERRDAGRWVMVERGDHPVDAAALAAFDRSLSGLTFDAVKTADPGKHARLGLGDPDAGGRGVRVVTQTGDGRTGVSAVFGDAREDGGWFVRLGDDPQTYAVSGDVPDLASVSTWLGLRFEPFARADVARVAVTPEAGPAYTLIRDLSAGANFTLAEPEAGWALLTVAAGEATGGAATQLRFTDVTPRAALSEETAATHTATTTDGLTVTLALVRDEAGDSWVTLDFTGGPDGELLQARWGNWAYTPPSFAIERIFRSLDAIAEPVTVDPGAPETTATDE